MHLRGDELKGENRLLAPLPAEAPAPAGNPTTTEKVALGKRLFFDRRLSGNNEMSCASCHDPKNGFGDGRPQAIGRDGKTLTRNTPSLLNVSFYSAYFWDGRAMSLEEQSLVPIQASDEMNQELAELEKELSEIPGYVEQFQAAFGTNVSRSGIAQALAAFQRTLVTGPSPFDRYIQGDKNSLSNEAKHGLELFLGDAGCVRCHRGPLLSDGQYYRLGVGHGDKGRGAVNGKTEDQYRFRTPSLRNISQTGPYMHDGSQKTLYDVVEFYYRGVPSSHPDGPALDVEPLLGQSFTEISPLVAFLQSLTGEAPEVAPPELP